MSRTDPTIEVTRIGLLAWLLPGAGHYALGQRGLAKILFIAISAPYLFGALVGGVKESINPRANGWLFVAECGVGSYTFAGWMLASRLPSIAPPTPSPYSSYYPESDVAQIYLATAGMLNLLAILDAMARASSGGQALFAREAARKRAAAEARTATHAAPPAATGAAPPSNSGSAA